MHSVSEAAIRMGLTERHVRLLLEQGRLAGRKLGHDWVVLSLDYKRKRKPKKRVGGGGEPDGMGKTPQGVWTEGSL